MAEEQASKRAIGFAAVFMQGAVRVKIAASIRNRRKKSVIVFLLR